MTGSAGLRLAARVWSARVRAGPCPQLLTVSVKERSKRPADDPGERAKRCGRERGSGSFQEAGGGKFTSGL